MNRLNLLSKITRYCIKTKLRHAPCATYLYHIAWKIFGPKGIKLFNIQNFKMYADCSDIIITPQLALTDTWEPTETEVFKSKLKKGMVVVDIGAHIGYYSLIASKMVGETGKVYAFEPYPPSYDLLVKNADINGCDNMYPLNLAVSNLAGVTRLYLSKKTKASNTITKRQPDWKQLEVPVVKLDDYFKGIPIDIIKMDIEGAEALALDGMKAIIKANKNLILLTEVFPKALESTGSSLRDYVYTLLDYFTLFIIDERLVGLEPYTNISQMREITRNGNFTNLLCIRRK